MLCEYCHQTIPSNMISCPHCGAANLGYRESQEELEGKIDSLQKELNNLKSRSDRNVTINHYTNVTSVNRTSSNTPYGTNSSPSRRYQSYQSDEDNVLALKWSALTAFISAIYISVKSTKIDLGIIFVLFYVALYILHYIRNYACFFILSSFQAGKFVKFIVCALLTLLGCFIGHCIFK